MKKFVFAVVIAAIAASPAAAATKKKKRAAPAPVTSSANYNENSWKFAKDSLPIHLSSLGGLIGALLSSVPADDLAPGDIFIANDPYVAGGTHLPDLNFAMPLFHAGELVCFIANIAHHSDFGGMSPGSMAGGMTEIYQEGLRVPVVRLYRGGKLVDDVLSLVLLNTRVTEERQGDLLAQVAACRLAERRFAELFRT